MMTLAIHYVDYRGSQSLLLRSHAPIAGPARVVHILTSWPFPLGEPRMQALRAMVGALVPEAGRLISIGRWERIED